MPKPTCSRCGREFPYPSTLKRHQARKTPCALIVENAPAAGGPGGKKGAAKVVRCPFCRRGYSSYRSMRHHIQTACRVAPNQKNGERGIQRLYDHALKKQQQCIEALKSRASDVVAAAPVINMYNDNRRVIVINHFGSESRDHITRESVKKLLDEAIATTGGDVASAAKAALLKSAMALFSDRLENISCFTPNQKRKSALVNSESGWDLRPTQVVMPRMVAAAMNELFDKQPAENAAAYASLMRELRDKERAFASGGMVKTVLERNKVLLKRTLARLPRAGEVTGRLARGEGGLDIWDGPGDGARDLAARALTPGAGGPESEDRGEDGGPGPESEDEGEDGGPEPEPEPEPESEDEGADRPPARAADFGEERPFEAGAVAGAIGRAGADPSRAMRELARVLWSGPDSPVRATARGELEVREGGAWGGDDETAPRVVSRLLDLIYESREGRSLIQRESLWLTTHPRWLAL